MVYYGSLQTINTALDFELHGRNLLVLVARLILDRVGLEVSE